MKFNAYILEKYGMTKEVYNSKPDWAKEELHKEHETYIREMQIQEAEKNDGKICLNPNVNARNVTTILLEMVFLRLLLIRYLEIK